MNEVIADKSTSSPDPLVKERSFISKYAEKNKFGFLLILTVIFGFIFRVINANTRLVYGDSPHFILHAIRFLDSGLLTLWDQSTFLWYALTDIFYKIFGITQFASRFASVLFGTLTIVVIYLFVKEFSNNKKIALISAILYAFIPTFVFHAADEHDVSVLFFIVTSFYFLILGLNKASKYYLFLSGIIFGIAIMWKIYVLLFLLPYLGMILYYWRTGKFDLKRNFKTVVLILVIIGLLTTPVLIYNYLNYKHNGIPTFFFVKYLGGVDDEKIKSLYGWVSGGELYKGGSFFSRVFVDSSPDNNVKDPSGLYSGLTYSLYSHGSILVFLILIGIIVMLVRINKDRFAKEYLLFYALYFIIPFLFLIDANILSKHYMQFIAFALPIVSYLFIYIYDRFSTKNKANEFINKNIYFVYGVIILIIFFVVLSFSFNGDLLFIKNSEGQLLKYKTENIGDNAFIIYDDRIYNSLAGWMFNDRNYVSVSTLNNFMEYNGKSTNKENVAVYIIECANPGECGWGVPKELNDSMNGFFSYISGNLSAQHVATFYEKPKNLGYYNPLISNYEKDSSKARFKVYKTTIAIDQRLAREIKKQYNYFMYPLYYENKEDQIYKTFIYYPNGLFEILLNKLAWFIFYVEIILSFLVIFLVAWEFYKKEC